MLTFLRRVFTVTPAVAALKERVSQLESDVEWLEADLKKLRGRVTGAERRRAASGDGGEPADVEAGDAAAADPGRAPEQAVRPHSLYRSLRGF